MQMSVSQTSVSEIHRYPMRPPGFEEPLFPTRESRRAVAEHLLRAPWLVRGSQIEGGAGGQAVHARREPVEIEGSLAGECARIVWTSGRRRRRRKRRVVEILASWREIRAWWDEEGCVDRMVFRVLLSGGVVVDLARERDGWFLVGVVD